MTSPYVFNSKKEDGLYTASNGAPYPEPYEAQRVGRNGPLLLQDFHLIDLISAFDRERIPERVVHAKGFTAHGTFEVTDDISDLTCAEIFSEVGNKCRASLRFSTVGGESGTPDTARDPRGFSVKLRTEQGNWDHVYNNTPVFFLRDPAKFPRFIHTQKRDPQTGCKSADMFWDYLTDNPESAHQVMILFGDRGVPDGYASNNGYSGHTHKLVKKDGSFVYAQFHYKSNQGIKFHTQDQAVKIGGENPDYDRQGLFEQIERGEYPSWTLYVQTMTPEQAEKFRYSIFDLTKVWPQKEFPLRKVATLTLNENVQNAFAENEQIAFSPSHLVPGIEPSADPVLQSRLFSYPDTHRHRIGVNYQQLPVNAPLHPPANFNRDGAMCFYNQGARPNYASTLKPLNYISRPYPSEKHEKFVGAAIADLSQVTELDFEQPRELWKRVFDDGAKERFVNNVSGHASAIKSPEVKKRVVSYFTCVSPDLGERIAKGLGIPPQPALKVAPGSSLVRYGVDMA